MILSTTWLAEYVRWEAPVDELVRRLLMSGLNHEATWEVGADTAVDIEVTSNRPDCLGHVGVAREVAVLFDRPLHIPAPQPLEAAVPTALGTWWPADPNCLTPPRFLGAGETYADRICCRW